MKHKNKLLAAMILSVSLLSGAGASAISLNIEVGDRPFYYGPTYWDSGYEWIWVPGHWGHHHDWIHGHYRRHGEFNREHAHVHFEHHHP